MENYWRGSVKSELDFWHMSCNDWCMAKKVNHLRLAQVNWGQAQVTNRRPAAESAALYLMQIRSARLKVSPLKKRLPILTDAVTRADLPQPVKIRQLG